MMDPRMEKLADLLIGHSVKLKRGEHVLIETFDIPEEMVIATVAAARRAGGYPHVALRTQRVLKALYNDAEEDALNTWADCDLHRMKQMQAYLGLRGSHNVSEHSDIPDDQMKRVARLYQKPVHFDHRVPHTRWCVLRWPTPAMAQLAQMSTEAFETFYFDVCTLDYKRMESALEPLAARMRATDRVRITGPEDTDLTFSINGIEVVPCFGTHNIPDGECYTAPVRDSVDGVIHFNTPTIYNGVSFDNVRLVFKQGRVVEASADGDEDKLNSIHHGGHEGHSLRREDLGVAALHPRPRLRGGGQRQPLRCPLGPGPDPAARSRRGPDLLRRRAGSGGRAVRRFRPGRPQPRRAEITSSP
jgi:aminopeptidase